MKNSIRFSLFAIGFSLAGMTAPSFAEELTASQAATYKEIEDMFGKVPEFVKKFPKAGIVGAWEETKSLEFSDKTALPPKTKTLIALAVAAQIPCEYCVYADTIAAKQAGATDEEIAEAVGMAALTRHWSTVFHGLQIDLAQFKKDVGGQ
jgi:AhpD family alkylhydroperoxidase